MDELREYSAALDELPLLLSTAISWPGKFQYDHYDWNDAEWKKRGRGKYAYRVIPLTQGYFMMVSPQDYKRMTIYPDGSPKRWHAHVGRERDGTISKVYAERKGRGDEPAIVSAHREVLNALWSSKDGDHINGWGLDNRRVNLDLVHRRRNIINALRERQVHVGLLRGVEKRGKNRAGMQHYGGKVCKRLKSGKVRTFRSKRTWLSQEPASRWYMNWLKRHNGRTAWAHSPKSVNYPAFPPSMDSEPTYQPRKRKEEVYESIPF